MSGLYGCLPLEGLGLASTLQEHNGSSACSSAATLRAFATTSCGWPLQLKGSGEANDYNDQSSKQKAYLTRQK